jgi:small subunit ribosomal protein S6
VKPYELVVLLHPDLEIDVDTPIAKLEKLVSGMGGSITKRDNWGKKRLAYPVKKQLFGIYSYFELELPPAKVRELEAQLLITEEVIRFLIVGKVVMQRPSRLAKQAKATTKPTAAVAVAEKE